MMKESNIIIIIPRKEDYVNIKFIIFYYCDDDDTAWSFFIIVITLCTSSN